MSDEILDDWILVQASRYHYRDIARFADGSFGSFKITHKQFKRELQEAFERGRHHDTLPDKIGQTKEWQRSQGQVK